MDLAALKIELAKPRYAGLSDEAAAEAVMAEVLSPDRRVPSQEIARLWARRGILARAREAGNRGTTAAARVLGWRMIDIVEYDVMAELDTRDAASRTEFAAFLDALVTGSLLTAQERTDTVALITKPRTGREVFGAISAVDVLNARAS